MFLPRLRNTNLQEFAAVILMLFVINSCGKDPYLYDRTGFDRDARPVVAPNPDVKTSVPEYYQQQPQYGNPYQQVPQGYVPASPYSSQYQNQQVPQGYAPAPLYPQQYQQQGGSRYYVNPYAIPPANNYYPQRYDVDQYYAPPTYYNNIEPVQPRRGSHVNSTGSTNY